MNVLRKNKISKLVLVPIFTLSYEMETTFLKNNKFDKLDTRSDLLGIFCRVHIKFLIKKYTIILNKKHKSTARATFDPKHYLILVTLQWK